MVQGFGGIGDRWGGVKCSQKMKSSFFDGFYVMPPLTNGGHYIMRKKHSISKISLRQLIVQVPGEAADDHDLGVLVPEEVDAQELSLTALV